MTYISEFTNAASHMHDYFAVKKSIQSGFTRLPVLRAARVLMDAQYSGPSAAFGQVRRSARGGESWSWGRCR